MKNRIDKKFHELKQQNKKALIAFITSGDPDQKTSAKILNVLKDRNIDLIEIGFPFSDPMADGPTIQKSSQRAIKAGSNLKKTFELIEQFRVDDQSTPIILMGYFNPIYQFGLKKFFLQCKKSGVDGLIVVDLPPEENSYISSYTNRFNIHNIRLLTPTTNQKRLEQILKHTKGFLYYISVMGITGTKKPSLGKVKSSVQKIKKKSKLPLCVGFGITKKNQVKEINEFAEGCVVGSAIVKFIEDFDNKKVSEQVMLNNISDFLGNLRK